MQHGPTAADLATIHRIQQERYCGPPEYSETDPFKGEPQYCTSRSSEALQGRLKRWHAWHRERGLDIPPIDESSAAYKLCFADELQSAAEAIVECRKAEIANGIRYRFPTEAEVEILVEHEYNKRYGSEGN